jgi:hypothetical protein
MVGTVVIKKENWRIETVSDIVKATQMINNSDRREQIFKIIPIFHYNSLIIKMKMRKKEA